MLPDPAYIKREASLCGFTLCGTAPCRPLSEHSVFFSRWLDAGCDSSLGYLRRHGAKRFDPSLLFEGARSVVVCALNYKNEAWDQSSRRQRGKVASYAYCRDYHSVIKEMLQKLLERIREKYPEVGGRAFVDTAPLLEKAWAVEAGLGWIGKNSLLVNQRYGSFLLLGELVLDTELASYDVPLKGERCGACRACMEECPPGALISPRVLDASLCISRATTQKVTDSASLKCAGLDGWLFGCDRCQSCCPYNKRSPMASHSAILPVLPPLAADEKFWAETPEEELGILFGETPLAPFGFQVLKGRLSQK